MKDAMLEYLLNPVVPERVDEAKASGGVATPAVRGTYNVESERARSLKEDGYIICGLIVAKQPDDFEHTAHSLFEIYSSEKVFPVLLCSEHLMTWKRSGFTVEWYSPDVPDAEAWLNDMRMVWGMDLVTDLDMFVEAHLNFSARNSNWATT
jgi:hypothetical protein